MKRFKVLFPDGGAIDHNTVIKGLNNSYRITTEVGLCKVIKGQWCKWAHCKNFTDWAKQLNDSGNYSSTHTVADALDNLCSNFHLEIDGKAIDLYTFFWTHLPLKNVQGIEPERPI